MLIITGLWSLCKTVQGYNIVLQVSYGILPNEDRIATIFEFIPFKRDFKMSTKSHSLDPYAIVDTINVPYKRNFNICGSFVVVSTVRYSPKRPIAMLHRCFIVIL